MKTCIIHFQEMETIRKEIAQLRANPLRCGSNPASNPYVGKIGRAFRVDRDTCWQGAVPALTDPSRVKKLTSFFGDEPPLLRIFLKKLGYEVTHHYPLNSFRIIIILYQYDLYQSNKSIKC